MSTVFNLCRHPAGRATRSLYPHNFLPFFFSMVEETATTIQRAQCPRQLSTTATKQSCYSPRSNILATEQIRCIFSYIPCNDVADSYLKPLPPLQQEKSRGLILLTAAVPHLHRFLAIWQPYRCPKRQTQKLQTSRLVHTCACLLHQQLESVSRRRHATAAPQTYRIVMNILQNLPHLRTTHFAAFFTSFDSHF